MSAQDCTLDVEGKVIDDASRAPLEFVNVFIQELSTGVVTDEQGSFFLSDICPGEYHVNISHIGCASQLLCIQIHGDTTLSILLDHSAHALETIVIEGTTNDLANQASESINRQVIEDNTNDNLSTLLETQTGVHLIKNGTSIAKPVVHGLFGNRLTILNNGIVQTGQQWGNDHGPEIDPYSADKIVVLKGASTIEYGGISLGSAVLVEPTPIKKSEHLHGQLNYAFESNGRGHTINSRFEKYSPSLAWRLNGTVKKYGDRNAPDYFLTNTGFEEANLSLQLEKSWRDKWLANVYLSTFNTELGVLRGSHIGNLTDLENALEREVPFFTEDSFTYAIAAPRQDVSHHLAKAQVKHIIDDDRVLDIVLAGQINDRKEFDVRRGGRETTPALSLLQTSFHADLKYTQTWLQDWTLKVGAQFQGIDNDNVPGTGILPLIPDYRSWRTGTFATINKTADAYKFHLGLRYDYELQIAKTISSSLPREIITFENNFHTYATLLGFSLKLSDSQTLQFNSGWALRAPAINELYSAGLHQGVSGIEEGDPNLDIEKALKNTLEYKWIPSANFSISALAYLQNFKNYIFLNPQDQFRLTIRGAFPLFSYEQTDANIYGLDVSTQLTLSRSLLATVKYSYIRGQDTSNDIPLVFIPPNSLFGQLTYRVKQSMDLNSTIRLEESEFELTGRWVSEQNRLLENQDFKDAPPAYFLLGFKASTNLLTSKQKFRLYVKADNVLDTVYRDYLNRQRYFADDLGRSITAGLSLKF